jgi:WD40 repeat protein
VCFSPDGKYIAVGGMVKRVVIWSLEDGKYIGELSASTAEIESISFSHDGKYLAVGSYDGSIILWDVK